MAILLFLPKGGLARIRLKRLPRSPAKESAPASIGVHAVQKEIHNAQASGIGNQFPAANKAGLQMLFLIFVHVVVLDDEIKGCEQEAAGRIANVVVGSRLDALG